MRKKIFANVCIGLMATLLLSGCGSYHEPTTIPDAGDRSAEKKAEIILRAGEANPEQHIMSRVLYEFADIVSEKSNGRIYVEVYPAGQLGDARTQLQTVQMGALDFVRFTPFTASDFGADEFALLSLPYLFTSRNHQWNVVNSEIGTELLEDITENVDGVVGLSYMDEGSRNFFATGKALKKPEDLDGMKIRISESAIMLDTMRCFNASPTPISYSELFTSLQTGVVDGADQPLSGYLSNSFNEVSPYMVADGHTCGLSALVMSSRTYNMMSTEDQKLIREAAIEASEFNRIEAEKDDMDTMKKLEEAGTPVIEPDNIAEWREKVQPVYEKYGKNYKKIIEKIQSMQ